MSASPGSSLAPRGRTVRLLLPAALAAALLASGAAAGQEDGRDDLPPRKEIIGALKGEGPIDLARLCMLLAKEDFSDLDVDKELKRIDALADEFRQYMFEGATDDYLCRRFRRFLFLEKLRCRGTGPGAGPVNLYPHSVLERGGGYCLGLSVIGISVARRLKLPIQGVAVPGHSYLKYQGRERIETIETTDKGTRFDEEMWLKEAGRDRKAAEAAGYLVPLTDRQVFASVLFNLSAWRRTRGDPVRALEDANLAVKLEPGAPEFRTARGEALLAMNDADGALAEAEAALKIDPLLRAPERLKKYVERTAFLRAGATAEKPAADWLEYQSAVGDLRKQQAATAMPRLEALAVKYPKEPEMSFALAVAWGQSGDGDKCLNHLGRAIVLGFNDPRQVRETADFSVLYPRKEWEGLMALLDRRLKGGGGQPNEDERKRERKEERKGTSP